MKLLAALAVMVAAATAAQAQSFDELKKQAEGGDARSQYALGLLYANGREAPQDDAEAMRWWRMAAEQGHINAQKMLGFRYFLGVHVPDDDAEAMKWYRKAAEQGDREAQLKVGSMYQNGWGVPKNNAEAARWFEKVIEQGTGHYAELAQKYLKEMQDAGETTASASAASAAPSASRPATTARRPSSTSSDKSPGKLYMATGISPDWLTHYYWYLYPNDGVILELFAGGKCTFLWFDGTEEECRYTYSSATGGGTIQFEDGSRYEFRTANKRMSDGIHNYIVVKGYWADGSDGVFHYSRK